MFMVEDVRISVGRERLWWCYTVVAFHVVAMPMQGGVRGLRGVLSLSDRIGSKYGMAVDDCAVRRSSGLYGDEFGLWL